MTKTIPEYLQVYVVEQNPSLYTWMDHASWRFILKLSRGYFKDHAHQKYLDGLRETGISTERIPLISEMNACLDKFGWQAVAVSGFIPPGVFMEFLALGVLPIACDMRKIEHISYTPAPDIVHEAAGHAPILADPAFARYLLSYGELARKAIYSSQDMDVYNAIRELSDVKEDPASSEAQTEVSQKKLDHAVAQVTYDSEATQLSRMGWWTFEYGLIGDVSNPKIYGAGLLSSVGESFHCLSERVKKIPFSLECVNQSFDITKPQPQLFVARDFDQLTRALEELSENMAFRRGGVFGLERARVAKTVNTLEYSSGAQVSGVLSDFIKDVQGEPVYIQLRGPTQLSYQDLELEGQGAGYHAKGFGSPVGVLADGTDPETLDEIALARLGFSAGRVGTLEFQSGVQVSGVLKRIVRRDGHTLVISFTSCTVVRGDQVLFDPSWGVFDMTCGARITSVFGGASDRKKYLKATGGFHQDPGKPKTNLTAANEKLNRLYGKVRELREKKRESSSLRHECLEIERELQKSFPKDWLLRYEMLELTNDPGTLHQLEEMAAQPEVVGASGAELIRRGLDIL